MNANIVKKCSLFPVLMMFLKEFTVERNRIHVSSVGKPSSSIELVTITKGFTLERNHMFVCSVGMHSLFQNPFKSMKETTLERSHMYVNNVGKHSHVRHTFTNMKEFTTRRNPVDRIYTNGNHMSVFVASLQGIKDVWRESKRL